MSAVETFAELHRAGTFVMPNPWDAGSAVFLASLGFRALATTSGGLAFARARPDNPRAVDVASVLAHVAEIASATPLPVNADFQSGYADDLATLAKNVAACVRAGAAGLSIEDASGDAAAPLYAREIAVERVAAARAAIDGSGVPALLTARCEAFLVGDARAAATVLDRLVAFAAAGADCLFAPGVRDLGHVREIVAAVAPKPVNVLVSSPSPELTVASLAAAGVRRISVGSALARVAWGAFMRAARELATDGSFAGLRDAASFAELNALFGA